MKNVRSLVFVSAALTACASFAACSGSDDTPAGTGGAGGMAGVTGGAPGAGGGPVASGGTVGAGGVVGGTGGTPAATGGTPAATGCNVDFTRFTPNSTPVSFKTDVMAIFGAACVAGGCHGPSDKKAGLYLGVHCDFDAAAKWRCTFPAVSNPDMTQGQQLTQQIVDEVYASVMASSMTAPVAKRVVAGQPAQSFLVDKTSGKQNTKGYQCTNQDSSHSAMITPCGDPMPQGTDSLCASGTTGPARFDAIVQWIVNGAQNN
jgi:hypothetical protein